MKRKLAGSLIIALALGLAPGRARAASQFVKQVVERPDTLGQVTSLSLDAQGNPRVAYWGPQRKDLRYAVKGGGAWSVESADSTEVLGLHASLALTATGDPRVAYFNQTRGDLE